MRGARITYSAEEMAWLEANRTLVISDYHEAFVAAFGRADVSAANLHGLRKRKGWRVGRAKGRLAGRHRRYSRDEIAWLQENCTLPIGNYHGAFVAKFDRADVTIASLKSLRKAKGWKTGRTGQFAKGQTPPNKGKRCPEGTGGRHPNARKTQFRRGQEPHNTKHLGHERINVFGYVEISVAETNPRTGFERRYVHKHRWLWEQANGPVPEGHCLKCLDGDKTNTDPSNWEAIPRALIPRLNGGTRKQHLPYNEAAPELRPTLIAIARVEHRARELRRGKAGAA